METCPRVTELKPSLVYRRSAGQNPLALIAALPLGWCGVLSLQRARDFLAGFFRTGYWCCPKRWTLPSATRGQPVHPWAAAAAPAAHRAGCRADCGDARPEHSMCVRVLSAPFLPGLWLQIPRGPATPPGCCPRHVRMSLCVSPCLLSDICKAEKWRLSLLMGVWAA